MNKVTPFLSYNHDLQEVIDFYSSIFDDAKFSNVRTMPDGKVMTATFNIGGQEFNVMNGGPHFVFSDAISLFITVDTQEEVDMYWEKLSEGGAKSQCGWLSDKFGLSWQVIPKALGELMSDPDPVKSKNVMDAMMKMTKIDIKQLQEAHDK
jgi:predicted 3-demethylubiquinone-9 3-methyltransferase (glyoxalase superfamily)